VLTKRLRLPYLRKAAAEVIPLRCFRLRCVPQRPNWARWAAGALTTSGSSGCARRVSGEGAGPPPFAGWAGHRRSHPGGERYLDSRGDHSESLRRHRASSHRARWCGPPRTSILISLIAVAGLSRSSSPGSAAPPAPVCDVSRSAGSATSLHGTSTTRSGWAAGNGRAPASPSANRNALSSAAAREGAGWRRCPAKVTTTTPARPMELGDESSDGPPRRYRAGQPASRQQASRRAAGRPDRSGTMIRFR
jgi:hypothetical protein